MKSESRKGDVGKSESRKGDVGKSETGKVGKSADFPRAGDIYGHDRPRQASRYTATDLVGPRRTSLGRGHYYIIIDRRESGREV
jgi:hypothetical protein